MEFEEVRRRIKIGTSPVASYTMPRTFRQTAKAIFYSLMFHNCCPVTVLRFYSYWFFFGFGCRRPGGENSVELLVGYDGSAAIRLDGYGKALPKPNLIDYRELVGTINRSISQEAQWNLKKSANS